MNAKSKSLKFSRPMEDRLFDAMAMLQTMEPDGKAQLCKKAAMENAIRLLIQLNAENPDYLLRKSNRVLQENLEGYFYYK